METIRQTAKRIIKERGNGLLLLFFAVSIAAGLAFNSQADSQEKSAPIIEEESEPQILGETNENKNENEEGQNGTDAEKEVSFAESEEKLSEGKKDKKSTDDSDGYSLLKSRLKKYCGKSGRSNKLKCRTYCSKADSRSKRNNDKYDDLHEKYCVNKDDNDDDEKDDSRQSVPADNVPEVTFIAESANFQMEFNAGETVFDLMKRARNQNLINFQYEEYAGFGAMITEINGTKNGEDNKYWMLYVDGKLSNEGCSAYKLTESTSKIEWKFEEFSGNF